MKITNSEKNITDHFKMNEYWKGTDFEIDECIPNAIEVLRTYFGIPFTITSTYRPNDPLTMPEAHRVQPPAVDVVTSDRMLWANIRDMIRKELREWQTSKLVHDMLDTGTNVILIENNCLHLHRREKKLHQTRQFGGIYLGEWKPDGGMGINTAYSFNTI